MSKNAVAKLFIAAVSILVALKLVDIAVHFQRVATKEVFEKPLNSQGFRSDRDYQPEREDARTRIGIIGDSFSFGWGVRWQESYVYLLESALNDGGKRDVEILNFAQYGASALTEYNILREQYPVYKPDVVIWQFYTNDIAALDPESQNPDGTWKATAETSEDNDSRAPRGEAKYLAKKMVAWAFPDLYNTLGPFIRQTYGLLTGYKRDVFTDPAGMYRNWATLYPTDILPSMEPRWQTFERIVLGAKEYVESQGSKFIFVVIPAEVEVGKQYQDELYDKFLYTFDEEVVASGYMRERLRNICADRKMACLDLFSVLKEADAEQEVFLRQDYHLTPFGNRIMAEELKEYLKSRDLAS